MALKSTYEVFSCNLYPSSSGLHVMFYLWDIDFDARLELFSPNLILSLLNIPGLFSFFCLVVALKTCLKRLPSNWRQLSDVPKE